MNAALLSLVGSTLVVCAGVAVLPEFWARQPLQRSTTATSLTTPGPEDLVLIQVGEDRWFLNGHPIHRQGLGDLLDASAPAGTTRYLPSRSLSSGQVARSLRWLEGRGLRVEMPPSTP
ncbi:hypothetical protein [Cyanobium sp. CH-040]|uniref:hypothetical protein n=1 Tax=Cyanobium sp. CH-040 TaxID=2823708 RepID=UPI0020CFCEFF|nr:hypothetical protein [Cyanobium sp. CH-040]MCP9929135.1 hypothetical protein [Cyanobium sp. CH-040]